jgi:hypothetical protein
MVTWGQFDRENPELAAAGRSLLYQYGVGLAYLATIRKDGGPRIHPMCPLLTDDAIYAFIIPSFKQDDLQRNGWYSMHSFSCPDNEDAFYFSGRARVVNDTELRQSLAEQFVKERTLFEAMPPCDDDLLFEFDLQHALHTKTTGHGDPNPQHTVWRVS